MAPSDSKMEAEISGLPEICVGIQGLRKRVLQKGNSWQTPFPGDEVEVHYSVQLKDGEYFDSSRDRGTPFRFKLGQCEVIKGWDEGIATMKKGERAIFTVPPDMAYGEVGSPPMIPPNATLIFDIEMVSWYSIRDITGDGGILKKIVNEGEGWATPKYADEVLVKYVASTEDGTIVSKSDGVEFSLTDGHFCPAMSKAVKTMRKGEKAELSVKFSYCSRYAGEGHCDNEIAPTSLKLNIQLELLSWKNVIDVTGDKKILKKITKMGEGFDRPNEGSLVKVIYTGKLEDGTVFESKGSIEEPFAYMCLEEQINEGLDKAMMTMRKGEQATVRVSSEILHGIESGEWPPSIASVLYEIMLIDFIKEKPFWKMDTHEKFEACQRKKSEGNALFKAGRFQFASKKYEKECDFHKDNSASKFIEFDHSFNDDEKFLANSLQLSCNLNNAACKLKLGNYSEAVRLCTKVLQLDPCCIKALFRRSQAYLRISEFENAEVDIRRALTLDPNNREVRLVYQELKDKQNRYFQHEAAVFTNMLSSLG